MSFPEYEARPSWRRTGDPYFPVAAVVDDLWWVLRVNSFPDHPVWTLFVDGVRRFDIDSAPPTWSNPADRDAPSLAPDEISKALAPVRAFVAYGGEVGQACDNPYCCAD